MRERCACCATLRDHILSPPHPALPPFLSNFTRPAVIATPGVAIAPAKFSAAAARAASAVPAHNARRKRVAGVAGGAAKRSKR